MESILQSTSFPEHSFIHGFSLGLTPDAEEAAKRHDAKAVAAAIAPDLHEGDILFIRTPSFVFRAVAKTTKSWESHVGLLLRDSNGEWVVAESAIPLSKIISLAGFLKKSEHGQFAVMRYKEKLSDDETAALHREANKRMGVLYHLGFKESSPLLFCSKFVYQVYLNALGVEIGKIETFGDLLRGNPDAPIGFWKLWFLGRIPWNRTTITPSSQYRSPLLRKVAEYVRN